MANLNKAIEILVSHYKGKKDPLTLPRAPERVEVHSVSDFIEHVYKRNLGNFRSLEEEIRHYSEFGIESPQVEVSDPQVAKDIQSYLKGQALLGKELWNQLSASLKSQNQQPPGRKDFNASVGDGGMEADRNKSTPFELQQILATLKTGSAREKKNLALALSDQIFDLIFSKIENAGADFANSANLVKIETSQTKGAGRFVQLLLTKYFSRLSLETKMAIVSSAIDHPGFLHPQKIMKLVTLNAGVIMTKWLQVLARAPELPGEFANTLKALESKGSPLPTRVVEEIINAERENLEKKGIQLIFDNSGKLVLSSKFIPVGSVAQTQFVYAYINGKKSQVALRITKPGIQERFDDEKKVFYSIISEIDQDPELRRVGFPSVINTLDDIVNAMEVDFDANIVAANQKVGKSAYTQELKLEDGSLFRISVPEVYYGSSNLMISDRVYGDNLELVVQGNQSLAKDIMDRIARLWITRSMMDKVSFFNADMHWGNFLVEIKPGIIEVSVLDFGMSDSIPLPLRKNFIGLVAGSVLRNPHLISEMLWDLRNQKTNQHLTKDWLLKKVQEEMVPGNRISPLDWIKVGATWGLDYQSEFVGFNRGLTAIMMGMGKTRGHLPRLRNLAELLLSENQISNFFKGLRLVPYVQIARNIGKQLLFKQSQTAQIQCSQLFKQ